MLIDIIDDSQYLDNKQRQLLKEVVTAAAQHLKLGNSIEVDISIVSDDAIRALNRDYRHIDKVTDVLSFALEENVSEFDINFDDVEIEYLDGEITEDIYEDEIVEGDCDSDAVLSEMPSLDSEVEQEAFEESLLSRHLGDIIIAYNRMLEQAKDYGHSVERELAFLAVHGFLHLNGFDHQTEKQAEEMFGLQEEILNAYGLTR